MADTIPYISLILSGFVLVAAIAGLIACFFRLYTCLKTRDTTKLRICIGLTALCIVFMIASSVGVGVSGHIVLSQSDAERSQKQRGIKK